MRQVRSGEKDIIAKERWPSIGESGMRRTVVDRSAVMTPI